MDDNRKVRVAARASDDELKRTRSRHVYGPVFSRRLGRSLGVDLVPLKTCTYDCIYCQLGRTTNRTIERKHYVSVESILEEVQRKLTVAPPPTYITLAGSGEPTLNDHLGDVIYGIKRLTRSPVAVLTNGSLLWAQEVREALREADLVLPSLDAGDAKLFQYVNRPHSEITFEKMVHGLAEFSAHFSGSIWLEVFVLGGVTGIAKEVEKISAIAGRIHPTRIQLNTVARPPAEAFTLPVSKEHLEKFAGSFKPRAEVIAEFGYAEAQDAPGGTAEDVLALLSRRPCTLEDVARGLGIHVTEAAKDLETLKRSGRVKEVLLDAKWFYTAAVSGRG